MECRPASAEDADRVAELLEQLGYPTSPEAARRRLQMLATSHNDDVWVAERGGAVIGLIAIQSQPRSSATARLRR